MRSPRLIFAASLLTLASALSAATLRVPQDFDTIQRAILAAEPGDTIALGEGTFHENLFINESVTLRGAGIGKTVLAGPDRNSPTVTGSIHGPITITDLTLGHAPAPPSAADERPSYPFTLDVAWAPLVLHHVRFERAASYEIQCQFNLVTFENVSVAPTANNPIRFQRTLPGTTIRGLTVAPMEHGIPIEIQYAAATFHDLVVGLGGSAAIRVNGLGSAATFVGASEAFLERVRWDRGAKHGGVPVAELDEHNKELIAANAQLRAEHQKSRDQHRKVLATRRKLARDLQAALKNASTPAAVTAALGVFVPKLYATLPADPDETDLVAVNAAIIAELRTFLARFGPAALEQAWEKLPSREAGQPLRDGIVVPFDLRHAVETARAATWVKANLPDLSAQLAAWKTTKPSDPATTANAFHALLSDVVVKAATADAPVKAAIRHVVLAEFNRWSTDRGPAAVDRFLRLLAAKPTPFLTLAQLQLELPPETKTALIRHWRSAK